MCQMFRSLGWTFLRKGVYNFHNYHVKEGLLRALSSSDCYAPNIGKERNRESVIFSIYAKRKSLERVILVRGSSSDILDRTRAKQRKSVRG